MVMADGVTVRVYDSSSSMVCRGGSAVTSMVRFTRPETGLLRSRGKGQTGLVFEALEGAEDGDLEARAARGGELDDEVRGEREGAIATGRERRGLGHEVVDEGAGLTPQADWDEQEGCSKDGGGEPGTHRHQASLTFEMDYRLCVEGTCAGVCLRTRSLFHVVDPIAERDLQSLGGGVPPDEAAGSRDFDVASSLY